MAAVRPIFVWPRDRLDDARFAEDITFEEVVSTVSSFIQSLLIDLCTQLEHDHSSRVSCYVGLI